MIDLPVVLSDRTAARGRTAGLGTIAIPWVWWMAPARLAGRLRPAILSAAAADAVAARRLPRLAVILVPPILVFILCAVVSLSNAYGVGSHPQPKVDWLRFTIDSVYTESAPFLLIVIALGTLSPSLGAFIVALFGVMDIAAASVGPYELRPFPKALAGRLVAIWLLWLLVVEIPIVGRQLGLTWRTMSRNRYTVAALTGVSTGALIWIWTQATLVLIRPVFIWASLPAGVTFESVHAIQSAGIVFVILGGVVAGVGALVRGPGGLLLDLDVQPAGAALSGPLAIAWLLVRRVGGAALLTIGLGGLITWQLEVVVLFVVLLGAGPLARFVADRTPLGTAVQALPPIIRLVVAGALSFGVAQLIIAPLYHFAAIDSSGRYPEFFSVTGAIAVGIILVQLATTPGSGARVSATVASSAAAAVVLAGAFTVVVLGAPIGVAADNCAGLNDCWGTPFLAALSAGALPMAMLYGAGDMLKYANRQLSKDKWDSRLVQRAPVLGVRG
jgi:hypothetical protein